MEQKIDVKEQINPYFLPQLLSIEEQKQRLRCPSQNQANYVCISKECSKSGLMCLETKCQCRRIHVKCHHILLDRVLQSIQKHQKQIPTKVKQIYQTIYDMINQMIQKLSKLRTKFQKEEQYFGLRQQQLQFIELINDSKIDQINGKMISSLQNTFDVQIQLNKNTKQDIIKDFNIKRNQFDRLCSYIEKSYLQTKEIGSKNLLIGHHLFYESNIIENKQQRQILNGWLKQQFNNKQIQSKLLFRASEHNFKSQKFHEFCDGKINTFVIGKNEFGKVIGGFTPFPWHSLNKDEKDQSYKSFVFSLNMKQKFRHVNQNKRSIYCAKHVGPTFGSGTDFYFNDNCHFSESYGQIGGSYNVQINGKNKYPVGQQQTRTQFTGNPNGRTYKMKQYEVYQITQKDK